MQQPIVSVCVITYNHQAFINQCLDGIIEQQTNFDYDIVIGEDCSTDTTASIIKEYARVHKHINFLDNSKNLGAIPNFIRTLKACKGKYIAFCEGDDYWIDRNKLQKQVDFLEQHPKYGGVCSNNRWFLEKENIFKDSILDKGLITFEDLCTSNKINSQTILFKKELITNLDWLEQLHMGDWPLHLMITNQQPYYRLPEITTVYRVHEGGIHSLIKEEQKIRRRLGVLKAVKNHLVLTAERTSLLNLETLHTFKRLIAYNPDDVAAIRKQYFKHGGKIFNKTLLKSYMI